MDGFSATEVLTRAVKYFLEGLAVAVAMVIIPQKVPKLDEILVVAVSAAGVFALLDLLNRTLGFHLYVPHLGGSVSRRSTHGGDGGRARRPC